MNRSNLGVNGCVRLFHGVAFGFILALRVYEYSEHCITRMGFKDYALSLRKRNKIGIALYDVRRELAAIAISQIP